jgi:hypothetical protein
MRRDVLTMIASSLATALMAWTFGATQGKREHFARYVQTAQWAKPDPELKRLSEESPYMRNER